MCDTKLKLLVKILSENQFKGMSIVLKAMCETVVKVLTHSGELKFWLISKTELLPGFVMAETLTVVLGWISYQYFEHE